MAFHNILNKLDKALVVYLVNNYAGSTDDVYPAKRDLNKVLPNTVCVADDFRESPPGSGNFDVPASIHVRTPAAVDIGEDTGQVLDASDERVQATFDCFYPDGNEDGQKLGELITAAAQSAGIHITVFSATVKGGDRGQQEQGSAWIDTLNLECYCAPSIIE